MAKPNARSLSAEGKKFFRLMQDIDHQNRLSEVFRDFVEMAFCTLAKRTIRVSEDRADELEVRYMRVAGRYDSIQLVKFSQLLAQLVTNGRGEGDFLGKIAGEAWSLNDNIGQFFTPYDVSRLMAQLLFDPCEHIEAKGFFTMHEPASGSGANILALAERVATMGYEPAETMLVSAVDIDQLAFQMCFLQLTVAGIPAQVILGDSLTMKFRESAWTPATAVFLAKHGRLFEERKTGPVDHQEKFDQAAD